MLKMTKRMIVGAPKKPLTIADEVFIIIINANQE